MTREIAHQKSFEKALYCDRAELPAGQAAGARPSSHRSTSTCRPATATARGPWNSEPTFDYREATPAVDGGSGIAEVDLDSHDAEVLEQAMQRQQSDPNSDPLTGAMLGRGEGKGAAAKGSVSEGADEPAGKPA